MATIRFHSLSKEEKNKKLEDDRKYAKWIWGAIILSDVIAFILGVFVYQGKGSLLKYMVIAPLVGPPFLLMVGMFLAALYALLIEPFFRKI